MKIRATRTFLNDIGMVRRGAEVDVRDVQAKSLIARGLAVALDATDTEKPATADKPNVKAKGQPPAKSAPAPKEGD